MTHQVKRKTNGLRKQCGRVLPQASVSTSISVSEELNTEHLETAVK